MIRYASLAVVPLLALISSAAYAQASAPREPAEQLNQLEEVVVTAQKRAENIQEVPLSIMSVSGKNLDDSGIRNAVDLGKLVPSLQINNGLFQSGVIIRIRGFGSAPNGGTDSDVAAYVDSAFIPRPGAIMGSFLDVKNVEVLSGPQGTLFGRNAAMGAISINSNAPSTGRTGRVCCRPELISTCSSRLPSEAACTSRCRTTLCGCTRCKGMALRWR